MELVQGERLQINKESASISTLIPKAANRAQELRMLRDELIKRLNKATVENAQYYNAN